MDTVVHASGATPTVLSFPALSTLQTGDLLEPGGVYLDLARPERGPFVAIAGQIAGSGNRYVARRDLSCPRWWRLVQSAAHFPYAVDAPRPLVHPVTPERAIWFAADDAAPLAAAR